MIVWIVHQKDKFLYDDYRVEDIAEKHLQIQTQQYQSDHIDSINNFFLSLVVYCEANQIEEVHKSRKCQEDFADQKNKLFYFF